jgi:hypothetical protein
MIETVTIPVAELEKMKREIEKLRDIQIHKFVDIRMETNSHGQLYKVVDINKLKIEDFYSGKKV